MYVHDNLNLKELYIKPRIEDFCKWLPKTDESKLWKHEMILIESNQRAWCIYMAIYILYNT